MPNVRPCFCYIFYNNTTTFLSEIYFSVETLKWETKQTYPGRTPHGILLPGVPLFPRAAGTVMPNGNGQDWPGTARLRTSGGNFRTFRSTRTDWVVVCGESGPAARHMDPEWAFSLKEECKVAGVPFFFKQGSATWGRGFKDMETFPEALRVRQFPTA